MPRMHRFTVCAGVSALACLTSCFAVFPGSALTVELPEPDPHAQPKPVVVQVRWESGEPNPVLGEKLAEGMAATGRVVAADASDPEAIVVHARFTEEHHENFTLWLSVATLTVLPGHSTSTMALEGEVACPDGARHPFRVCCEKDNWMWAPLFPIGTVQWFATYDAPGMSDLPEALVGFMLERGILQEAVLVDRPR
jgi:hypothetical protein